MCNLLGFQENLIFRFCPISYTNLTTTRQLISTLYVDMEGRSGYIVHKHMDWVVAARSLRGTFTSCGT